MKKKTPTDYRLYIHLPIRAYKDRRMQKYRQALFVLAALCSHTDFRGICWPNQATLAKQLRVSRQAITRYIKRLIEWGYVKYARKEFKGQRGNCYFVIYEKKTTETMARKNVSLVKHDIPIVEQEEAKKTLNKLSTAQDVKATSRVAKDNVTATSDVAANATSDVARNVSYNVTNNKIGGVNRKRQLMMYMKKAILETYGRDFQYNYKQEDEAQKILDCGVDLDDSVFEKMKAALIWFNKKEPRKDPPNHINFFKNFIINKSYKNTKSKG